MSKGKQKPREKPALQPCEDPNSREYRQHRWVEWGDDSRYARCRRCGVISAEGISNEARYGRGERTPDRRPKHRHDYQMTMFGGTYQRCACGATRKIPAPVGGAA